MDVRTSARGSLVDIWCGTGMKGISMDASASVRGSLVEFSSSFTSICKPVGYVKKDFHGCERKRSWEPCGVSKYPRSVSVK